MVTVFECYNELGFFYQPDVLSALGQVVRDMVMDKDTGAMYQFEHGNQFMVRCYPDKWKEQIKMIIKQTLTGDGFKSSSFRNYLYQIIEKKQYEKANLRRQDHHA